MPGRILTERWNLKPTLHSMKNHGENSLLVYLRARLGRLGFTAGWTALCGGVRPSSDNPARAPIEMISFSGVTLEVPLDRRLCGRCYFPSFEPFAASISVHRSSHQSDAVCWPWRPVWLAAPEGTVRISRAIVQKRPFSLAAPGGQQP
jgi:hypothetical protein